LARRRFAGAFPARRQGPRRETEWGAVTFGPTAVDATPVLLATFTQTILEGLVPATIVRVRGMVTIVSDQSAAPESIGGAFGMVVVKQTAATAGVASVPSPITEIVEDGWFVYAPYLGTARDSTSNYDFRLDIDSKAMRKLQDGDAIALVGENGAGFSGVEISGILRLLFKLH